MYSLACHFSQLWDCATLVIYVTCLPPRPFGFVTFVLKFLIHFPSKWEIAGVMCLIEMIYPRLLIGIISQIYLYK